MTLQAEQRIAGTSNDDIIQVRLKDEAVIKYLSEGIYTSWKSAIRELFANELTAALTSKEIDPNANPTIEIRIDPETRGLTIHGIDSLGITQDTFADKLIYYGRSGNTSSRKLGRFGFGLKCVSSDTECLTIDGWRKYADITTGTLIATYNIKEGLVEYQPLRAIHTYKYDGDLFRLGWSHGPIVTGNHRNVVSRLHSARQGGSGRQGPRHHRQMRNGKLFSPSDLFPRKKFRTDEITETTHLSNTDKILLTASHKYIENEGLGSEDLAALIGWVITEGNYLRSVGKGKQEWRHVTAIRISQNEGAYADEIRNLLRRLGTTWTESLRKNKAGNVNILFAIHGPLANRIRQIAPDKHLNSFLASLPRNELEDLFWAMIKGDGSPNHANRGYENYFFHQKSRVTIDWFQIIALRLGYYCGTKYDAKGNVSVAYISKRKYRGLNRGHGRTKLVTPVGYSGIVWCPEVDNGTWVARRDGWPFITGNSYVSLGKNIKIETYARETGEKYGIVGSEGTHFRRIPDDELTISQYGTKISIALRDEEREEEETSYSGKVTTVKRKIISFEDLIKTIRDVCRFSDVDTYLTITSDIKEKKYYSSYYSSGSFYESSVAKAGREKINYSPKEYANLASHFMLGDRSTFEFKLDDSDFYFHGVLATSGGNHNEVSVDSDNGEVRLLKMPIEVTIPESRQDHGGGTREVRPEYPMTCWLVNLKDETVFEPTPDRERLKEGLYSPVHEKIVKFLKDKFAGMEIGSFEDYRNSKYREIIEAASPSSDLREFLTVKTCQVRDVLETDVIPASDSEEEEESRAYRSRWRSRYSTGYKLKDLVLKSEHLFMMPRELTRVGKDFVLPKKRARLIQKVLRTKYPDAIVFMHPGVYDSFRFAERIPSISQLQTLLREEFHIKDAKTEADKIRKELGKAWSKIAGVEKIPNERKKEIDEVVVWKSNSEYGRIEPIRINPSQLSDEVVRIKGNMKEWVDLLKKYSIRQYGVTKEIKGLNCGISEEEFRDHLSATAVATVKGTRRLDEVSKSKLPIMVFHFCDPEILEYYKPKGYQIICTTTSEETFAAAAYLKLSAKEFTVTDVVNRKTLAEMLKHFCGTSTKRESDHDRSIWSFVDFGSKHDLEVDENDWTESQQEAINYLYMALSSMIIAQKKYGNGASAGNHEGGIRLVSLLWDALSNVYDTGKMKHQVETAMKYYPAAVRVESQAELE